MRRRTTSGVIQLLISAAFLAVSIVHAQELVLDPDCPSPQQSIHLRVFPGGSIATIGPLLSTETRSNEIRITASISTATFVPVPVPPFDTTIGPFPAGSYTVNVVGRVLVAMNTYGPEIPVASREFQVQDNPPACTPSSIALVSPYYQETGIQQAFPAPIEVRISDNQDRPVSGVTVFFDRLVAEVLPDSQSPNATFTGPQVTDTNGIARTIAVANGVGGVAQYRASYRRAGSHSVYFVLANRAAPSGMSALPIVEFYNTSLRHYFITGNLTEQRDLDSGTHQNWFRTGNVFLASSGQTDAVPVCRLYGLPTAGLNSHFYSADRSECDATLQRWPTSWILETYDAFQSYLPDRASGVCPTDRIPVYRLYNGRADANHRYTTSPSLKAALTSSGWIPEGYGPEGVALCALR